MASNVPAKQPRTVLENLFHYAVANGEKLKELWDIVNKDDRAGEAVTKLIGGVRQGMAEREPVARLNRQLDAIAEAVELDGAPDPMTTELRRARIDRIRSKLALTAQMQGQSRKRATERLTSEVSALFAEMVEDGLESEPAPAQVKIDRKLPWQRKSNPSDF
ncbi:hypothetical protein [Aestuariimicrobium ganziense]|uniref:hypothetical protein n=1 Tax=Aestuariimicrobium ganziense TaxID=2773677 RepID=UPI0019411F4B|nr:hypothetical protein [Aestuariimicrobium ganziense]